MKRNIIRIDEDKCNGCGQCVTTCAEGALQIINGKARLVRDSYCDGLGACLGDCPTGALTIIQREADAFDETLVAAHAGGLPAATYQTTASPGPAAPSVGGFVCPGTAFRALKPNNGHQATTAASSAVSTPSGLGNWPVQLRLIGVNAPCFQQSKLVVAADCAPFAYADFHRRFLDGAALVIGCPKLDDTALYRDKLRDILRLNSIEVVEVVHMEVPCCHGLVNLVQEAVAESGRPITVRLIQIGIDGTEMLSTSSRAGCGV